MMLTMLFLRTLSRLFATRKKSRKEKTKPWHYDNNASLPKLEWINMLGRTVFLQDGLELGKIEALNTENIVIKKGAINPTRYYFSHCMLKKEQSGHYIIDLTSSESVLYQRDMVPNPSYYVTLGGSYFGYMPHIDEETNRS